VEAPRFSRVFRELALRVRRRRALRSVLTASAVGAGLALAAAAALWGLRLGAYRPYAGGLVALAALAGWMLSRRRRWSDAEVALFLDARLASDESFTTGVLAAETDAGAEAARARALSRLEANPPKQLGPRVLVRWHAALPIALSAFAWVCLLAPRAVPQTAKAPRGVDVVKRDSVRGLERIEALAQTEARSAADAERLKALSSEAKKLSEDLKRGIERREAQARIGKLREELAGERQRFNGPSERPGLEAALRALEAERSTLRAQRALSEGDVVGFDDEMRKLANQAESEARQAAKERLDEAARAAKERGGKKLSEFLEQQKKRFAEREALGKMLRELSKELGEKLDDDARRELEKYLDGGDPESAQRLAEAYGRALAELSEEERERLMEALKKQLDSDSGLGATDPKQLESLLDQLETERGRQALRDALRDAARGGREGGRERALEDAERGGAEAERSLGGLLPVPAPGGPGPQSPGNGQGQPQSGGPGPGSGSSNHEGETPKVEGSELRSKAQTRVLPGVPLGARGFGRAPGRSGETANQVGTGELGSARADAIGAIEGSDVPEDYREHVGRYFEP
jgi:hypothetical protein